MTSEQFKRAEQLAKSGSLVIPPEDEKPKGLWVPSEKESHEDFFLSWLSFPVEQILTHYTNEMRKTMESIRFDIREDYRYCQ